MQSKKKIYLTIDDSPSEDFEEKLNFLHTKDIPAVFFCEGKKMEARPSLVIDAIKKGYIIANHSYSHPHFSQISISEAKSEIFRTDKIISDLYTSVNVRQPPKLFRFPYGDKGWGKSWNFKYKALLPYRIRKLANGLSGKRHKQKIQNYLHEICYIHPKLEDVTYPFYQALDLKNDHDLFWTFDFCEYKIESVEKIYQLIEKRNHWDIIHSKEYKIGSLSTNNSSDIVLIHDHVDTTQKFYDILDYCIDSDYQFCSIF